MKASNTLLVMIHVIFFFFLASLQLRCILQLESF